MKSTRTRKHLSYLCFTLGLCALLIAALADSPTPTRAAPKAPDPFYQGSLDIADCTQIKGWAWDSVSPYDPINVDIYDGPNLIMTVPANRFRQDLLGGGIGDGRHGFLVLTPSFLKDGQVHSISVKFGGTNIHLEDSPLEIACEASLFPTAVPLTIASGQGQTWEQGIEFSSSVKGIIKKVRFWRAAEEPKGGHLAVIRSASGNPLKVVSFNETDAPGWQYATVNFSINANTRYKVTYNIHQYVSKTFNVFQNGPIVSGPLTAHGSWYGTPAGSHPITGSTSNLFADIIFNSPR